MHSIIRIPLYDDRMGRCGLDARKYTDINEVEDVAAMSAFETEELGQWREQSKRATEQAPWNHDAMSHIAVHTPIQVPPRCDPGGTPLFHPLQAQRWLHPQFPAFTGGQPPPFFRLPAHLPPPPHPSQTFLFMQDDANKKVSDWQASNNNSTIGQQIWEIEQRRKEERQQQRAAQTVTASNGTPKTPQPESAGPPRFTIESSPLPDVPSPKDDLIAPKPIHADTRQLLEASASLSPEEPKSEGPSYTSSHSATDSSDDDVRMETDVVDDEQGNSPQRAASPQGAPEQPLPAERPPSCNEQVSTSSEASPTHEDVHMRDVKEDDPSSLLLNFSNQSFMSSNSTDAKDETVAVTSTALPPLPLASSPTPATSASQSTSPSEASASLCRPPGLGPAALPAATISANGQQHFVCGICSFSCSSKFHFNSHMNTHGDHQCQMCDYTSRTEGRLKKHMRESHSVEEQLAVGLEIEPVAPPRTSTPITLVSAISTPLSGPSHSALAPLLCPPTDSENNHLQTTMASLMEAVNRVVNSQAQTCASSGISNPLLPPLTPATSLASALGLEGLLGNLDSTDRPSTPSSQGCLPTALDQIRAFTENASLLPDSAASVSLASALGVVSQSVLGSPESSEALGGLPKGNGEQRRSGSGKPKTYKCKQCPQISLTKDEQWAHARTHIPLDKQMSCPKCNFVTEYKHHLEYHIRNHMGEKPFRCEKCAYVCVNKSMLNSHMKSHNNVYQFRCADCTYATKYCHSLKLHLRKYGHRKLQDADDPTQQPGMMPESAFQRLTESVGLVLNSHNEKPSLLPPTSLAHSLGLTPLVAPQPHLGYPQQPSLSSLLLRQHPLDQLSGLLPPLPQPPTLSLKCTLCEFSTGSQEELIHHNMSHILAQTQPLFPRLSLPPLPPIQPPASHDSGIDVVKDDSDEHEMTPEHDSLQESSGCSSSPVGSSKSSGDEDGPARKRKAFKLEQISQRLQGKSPSASDDSLHGNNNDDETLVGEPSSSPSDVHLDILQRTPPSIAHPLPTLPNVEGPLSIFLAHLKAKEDPWRFHCSHCRMAFQDQALYHIHMGYHGYEHVFKCNRCGHHAHDPLNFNLHLLQASHQ